MSTLTTSQSDATDTVVPDSVRSELSRQLECALETVGALEQAWLAVRKSGFEHRGFEHDMALIAQNPHLAQELVKVLMHSALNRTTVLNVAIKLEPDLDCISGPNAAQSKHWIESCLKEDTPNAPYEDCLKTISLFQLERDMTPKEIVWRLSQIRHKPSCARTLCAVSKMNDAGRVCVSISTIRNNTCLMTECKNHLCFTRAEVLPRGIRVIAERIVPGGGGLAL